MNIDSLKLGIIGLWLPPTNTYAMLDMGYYDGSSFTTNNKLVDISGNGLNMSVSGWTSANRINYTLLKSTTSTRVTITDVDIDIEDFTLLIKRDCNGALTALEFGFIAENVEVTNTPVINFEGTQKVGSDYLPLVRSLGGAVNRILLVDGWSYLQKDNYNGLPISYGNQKKITRFSFARARMKYSSVYCVAFWNRKLSLEEILYFELLADSGVLYERWRGKALYNYIDGVAINSRLIETANSYKWANFLQYSKDVSITTLEYKRELPSHTNLVYGDKLCKVDKVGEIITADVDKPATLKSTYLVAPTKDFKLLFPSMDFLLCPKMLGITDGDLERGVQLANLAGDKYLIYFNTSSHYLYPDKRLVKLDYRLWLTYNVDGVADGGLLWTTYPYSMLGCGSHLGDSDNNYSVCFIWRRKGWTYFGDTPYNIWNGVELLQNYQNWNSSGMLHFIDATNSTNQNNPERLRFGMCMNSIFTAYPPNMFSDLPADYLLVISYNCTGDSIYPKCKWLLVNLTENIDSGIHQNCRGQNQRPTNPVNVYFRCPANNTGSVGMLGVLDKGLNELEFTTLVRWCREVYADLLA